MKSPCHRIDFSLSFFVVRFSGVIFWHWLWEIFAKFSFVSDKNIIIILSPWSVSDTWLGWKLGNYFSGVAYLGQVDLTEPIPFQCPPARRFTLSRLIASGATPHIVCLLLSRKLFAQRCCVATILAVYMVMKHCLPNFVRRTFTLKVGPCAF